MTVTAQQLRLLMKNYERTGSTEKASAKADMCRQTGAKYLRGSSPQGGGPPGDRHWRTRKDPLHEVWSKAEEMLSDADDLEAKTLFDWLCREYPESMQECQLRTFQRRVRQWRATSGPGKEVFFPQEVEPGRRMSVDFTSMNSLDISINGAPFPHMLCQSVLCYSNWQWATVCFSESFQALRAGVQAALFRMGRVPRELWTDNSTSATHNPAADEDGERQFNQRYLDMTSHFGMEPHTTSRGRANENGDVESANGHLKRRVKQHLLLRGSRDFESRREYEIFLTGIFNAANNLRRERLREEFEVMQELKASALAEWDEERTTVRKWSVVSVARNTYSVPSRLIGEKVVARLYEDKVRIYFKDELQLEAPRLRGRGMIHVDYRHVIHSLVRKPGAFRDYRYKTEMFPTLNFRKAYDRLHEVCVPRTADLEYLRILKLAADTTEETVDGILERLLSHGAAPRWATVEDFIPAVRKDAVYHIKMEPVQLAEYDILLGGTLK